MTTESEDQLTRIKVNVSPNSTESRTEEVKVHRAPVVAKSEKKPYCERHPKLCKVGRGAATVGLVTAGAVILPFAATEYAVDKTIDGAVKVKKKLSEKQKPKTETKPASKKSTPKKKSPSKSKTTVKKTSTKTTVKKKPASKKSTPKKSSVKKKTTSKTTTKKKSSSRKDDLSYWRM